MVGGQTRSKGLPTDPRTQTAGVRDMVPPGGWGLVDNKRNTHTDRYNQFIETFRGSQSGFPLLTPTMQAGQEYYNAGRAGLGWMRERQCVRCMQWLCCVFGNRRPSPAWRLISTLFGESATCSFVRCSSIQVPELSDSDSYSGSPQPFITRSPEDL